MIDLKKAATALVFGLAVCAAAAPASARSYVRSGDTYGISASRAAALHDCSAVAGKFAQQTWGVIQGEQFGACMAEHGQMK